MEQRNPSSGGNSNKSQLTPMPTKFKSIFEVKAFMDEYRGFGGKLKQG